MSLDRPLHQSSRAILPSRFPLEDSIDERRKYAILFSARILAARKLHELDDRPFERLRTVCVKAEQVRLVMSIPGIDYTVAQTCLAATGDIARFPNAKKLAAYLGLNPSTRQSGPHCYHGPITKQGNAHARWLLVQAAQHLGQYRGPLGQTMRRIIQRKNRSVAVVACARKLAVLLWHVLSSGEPFRYALPKSLEAKCSRLRVRATGRRRRGGVAKRTSAVVHQLGTRRRFLELRQRLGILGFLQSTHATPPVGKTFGRFQSS